MRDVLVLIEFMHLHTWQRDVYRVTGDIPTIVCGNKSDCDKDLTQTVSQLRPAPYIEMSVKTNANCRKPFVALARTLTGHDDLCEYTDTYTCPPVTRQFQKQK